jgi:hypothetical protein
MLINKRIGKTKESRGKLVKSCVANGFPGKGKKRKGCAEEAVVDRILIELPSPMDTHTATAF